jgi:hypothetical protein
MKFPDVDVMNTISRGAITKDFNAGLRNPQAKKLSYEMYNSGCEDLSGCVEDRGYKCSGPIQTINEDLNKAYKYLNAPLLTDGYEFRPPSYMQGIKNRGPNSVNGWAHSDKKGSLEWEKLADQNRETALIRSGIPLPLALEGCNN